MFTAFIPIKLTSERVVNKNFRIVKDKPLYHYILNTLKNVDLIDEIVIDYDKIEVREQIVKDFDGIKFFKRPKSLANPLESVNNLILSNLKNFNNNNILQTHVTNPLLNSETVSRALTNYKEEGKPLFSVTTHRARFYNHNLEPINHSPNELLPTQELNPIFEENSNFYIFSKNQFMQNKRRINVNSNIFEISKLESLDIDSEEDLELFRKIIM